MIPPPPRRPSSRFKCLVLPSLRLRHRHKVSFLDRPDWPHNSKPRQQGFYTPPTRQPTHAAGWHRFGVLVRSWRNSQPPGCNESVPSEWNLETKPEESRRRHQPSTHSEKAKKEEERSPSGRYHQAEEQEDKKEEGKKIRVSLKATLYRQTRFNPSPRIRSPVSEFHKNKKAPHAVASENNDIGIRHHPQAVVPYLQETDEARAGRDLKLDCSQSVVDLTPISSLRKETLNNSGTHFEDDGRTRLAVSYSSACQLRNIHFMRLCSHRVSLFAQLSLRFFSLFSP